MKKVLVGLLALAFVGGSAFAQEWRFSGDAWTGLGMRFTNFDDSEGIGVGAIGNDAAQGHKAALTAEVSNAAGTAGFLFGVESVGASETAAVSEAFGWLGFMDNMLTLYGGNIDSDLGGFNSLDRMSSSRMGEGYGLQLLVRPMDGLTLGFGAFAAAQEWMVANPSTDTGDTGQAKFTFHLRFEDPELFAVTVGLRNTNEVGRGFDAWQTSSTIWTARDVNDDTQGSAAYFSFAFLGLQSDGIHIAASAFFQNLEKFSDFGSMHFYASFGHTGLVDGMDLRLGAGFGMNNAADNAVSDVYTPFIWVWASVDYQLSDTIVPRMDLHYVRGGMANFTTGLDVHHRNAVRRGSATYNEDMSFVRIQPSVQFRVQSNTHFELGLIADIWLGEDSDAPYDTLFANTAQVGAYGLVRVSF